MTTDPQGILAAYLTDSGKMYDMLKIIQNIDSIYERLAPDWLNGSGATCPQYQPCFYSGTEGSFNQAPAAGHGAGFMGVAQEEIIDGDTGKIQMHLFTLCTISGTVAAGDFLIPTAAGALVSGDQTSGDDYALAVAFAMESGTDTEIQVFLNPANAFGLSVTTASGWDDYINDTLGTVGGAAAIEALVDLFFNTSWVNVAVDGTGTAVALVCGDVVLPLSDGTTTVYTTQPNTYIAANATYSQSGTALVVVESGGIAVGASGAVQYSGNSSPTIAGTAALGVVGWDSGTDVITYGASSPAIGQVIDLATTGCGSATVAIDTSVSSFVAGGSTGVTETAEALTLASAEPYYEFVTNTSEGSAVDICSTTILAGTLDEGDRFLMEPQLIYRDAGDADLPIEGAGEQACLYSIGLYVNTIKVFEYGVNDNTFGSTGGAQSPPGLNAWGFTVTNTGINPAIRGGRSNGLIKGDPNEYAIDVSTTDMDIEIVAWRLYTTATYNIGFKVQRVFGYTRKG